MSAYLDTYKQLQSVKVQLKRLRKYPDVDLYERLLKTKTELKQKLNELL
jgi:hypothetical protein